MTRCCAVIALSNPIPSDLWFFGEANSAEERSGHRYSVDSWGGAVDRPRLGARRRLEVAVMAMLSTNGQVRDDSRTPGYKWV